MARGALVTCLNPSATENLILSTQQQMGIFREVLRQQNDKGMLLLSYIVLRIQWASITHTALIALMVPLYYLL